MQQNQNQGPQPQQRRNPLMTLMVLVGVGLVVFLIINAMSGGVNATRINVSEFDALIGRSDVAQTHRFETIAVGTHDPALYLEIDLYFNPNARLHSAFQQGGTFYMLVRPLTGTLTQAQISDFASNPRSNATHFMSHNFPGQLYDTFRDQDAEARRLNTAINALNADIRAYNELHGLTGDAAIAQIANTAHPIPFSDRLPATSWWNTVFNLLPILLLLVVMIFIWRSMAGRNSVLGMGRNRATVVMNSPVRFNDVAGIEEEKAEVEEIIQFLRSPRKFLELGARIPKGFLLVGAPGTGKTLLAKAIAGEAGVPFFSVSGSDFSEMLVGVGPSRMRDLFEQAKANAPCIIFIDEVESIAKMRGISASSAGEENEQTLNQLLVQMDGFTKSEGVIVLAATNRPDVLDPALLRPGRFDRQIVVQVPDVAGREKILRVHAKNKPISSDVDLKRVAQIISGFTGADIENLMNESAIIAAKKNRKKITMVDITEGINKVLLGPQKRSRIITDEDKKITAYHEAGHAVISYVLQPKQTVQEVSIVQRGMAAGYVLTNDKDDVTAHKSKAFLKTQLAVYMGGRAAETMFIGDICTGATSDIKQATGLAERMVTQFGMSDKLGPLFYGRSDEIMLRATDRNISDKCQELIDSEVRELITESEKVATEILSKHKKQIEVMVEILLERETIYAEDVKLIMDGAKKDEVIAQIEERASKAKELEAKERIESELEILESEFDRVRQMAKTLQGAKILDEEKLAKLESNFDLAREALTNGVQLGAIPTIDNIDTYATIVGKHENTEETDGQTVA